MRTIPSWIRYRRPAPPWTSKVTGMNIAAQSPDGENAKPQPNTGGLEFRSGISKPTAHDCQRNSELRQRMSTIEERELHSVPGFLRLVNAVDHFNRPPSILFIAARLSIAFD